MMSLRIAVFCLPALVVAGCSSLTPAQQSAAIAAGTTLASVAAAQNTTVANIVAKGALFCKTATPAVDAVSAGVVAVAVASNPATAPVIASVTGQANSVVAAVCAALNGVPVPAPADPSSVPVVAAPTLPAAQ